MENIKCSDLMQKYIDFLKREYVHTGKTKEDTEKLLCYIKTSEQLAAWYYVTSEIFKQNFIVRLKDIFLNCQDNIKKIVFEYETIVITYEELLKALVENFDGITQELIAPYLTENC